jgi:hypothetical protein
MPSLLHRTLPLALVLLAAACAPAATHAQGPDSDLVAEARAFMEAYGRDLAAGNREAIAARYDRGGPYIMFDGERERVPWEELATQYRTEWRAPAAFEWRNLVFLPAGPDAVVVNGHFFWTRQGGAEPTRLRYTALLVRQEGELRIRLEDESVAPARESAPPAMPPATP